MAEKQSFVMHMMWGDVFENLPKEKAGELIQAIYAYQKTGEVNIGDPVLSAVFEMMRSKMDDDTDKYWKQVERNQANGKKGGRPKTQINPQKPSGFSNNPVGASGTQWNPQKPDNDNDTDNVNDNVSVNDTDTVSPDGEDISVSTDVDTSLAKPTPKIPYSEIADTFNETCGGFLPKVERVSKQRKQKIKSLYNEYGLQKIYDVFDAVARSDFLSGRSGAWRCSFDWLLNQTNFLKVLEGNYENNKGSQPSKISGHDELNEYYYMLNEWVSENEDGDSGGY